MNAPLLPIIILHPLAGLSEREVARRAKASANIRAYNASGKHGRLRHGHCSNGKYSPEYITWANMITRCGDPKNKSFERYGGRGIRVCPRWRNDFAAFLADMGLRPNPKLTLDRINNDGNYEPGNCRWATTHEQRMNQRPCTGKPNSRGEKNAMAKLTEQQARAILARRGDTHESIAKDFGVRRETVSMLLRGQTWKHIQRPADELGMDCLHCDAPFPATYLWWHYRHRNHAMNKSVLTCAECGCQTPVVWKESH